MKRGTGSHCFDNDTLRSLWEEQENCAFCHVNGADSFDHIEGRAAAHTDSVLNAVPVHNQKCNIALHGEMHTHENKVRLFIHVFIRLFQRKYDFQKNDYDFVKTSNAAQEALGILFSSPKVSDGLFGF